MKRLEIALSVLHARLHAGRAPAARPPGTRPAESFTLAEQIGAEDRGFAAAEASATAEGLLAVLSERERRAIHLRFHHDLTQGEIARHIGCARAAR